MKPKNTPRNTPKNTPPDVPSPSSQQQQPPPPTPPQENSIQAVFSSFQIQPLQLYIAGGIVFVFVLLVWFSLSKNEYQKFMELTKVEQLIQQKRYEVALALIDSALQVPEMKEYIVELNQQKTNITQLYQNDKDAPSFHKTIQQVDVLTKDLSLDSSIALLQKAIDGKFFNAKEQAILVEKQNVYKEIKTKLLSEESFKMQKEYKIKGGETLLKIAKAHGMTLSEIRKLNHLEGDAIKEGQKIWITETLTPSTHTVKMGESISFIANKYQMSIRSLRTLNALSSDALREGQTIKVLLPSKPQLTQINPSISQN